MKRIILAVIFGVASLSSINTKAQVSLNINIGSQPQWGPTGYDHVDYYYLPDVDAYYNVPAKQYVYLNNGSWVWRSSLPSRYSGFDLYNSYKVVMNTPKPYLSHQTHVTQYSKYKGYKGKQGNIRDSKDTRYVNARNNGGRGNTPVKNNTPSRNNNPASHNAPVNNGNNGHNNGKGNDNRPDNKGGRGH
ncbi:hypothetical protein SAMN06265348_109216 [Pedobacter westerhofensis]|uniref:YXWGXW repeat-containing protein n=1 Tax=Pedobacter westerhofensis TaxID=425512 RepID=A0A521EWD6_9SPHI|nr:hypothetical protein [Pedobacter westerhofensis]SMO88262.1 hypothetical protein SAMN06265348_109216 [Pedobacter westerhofensis]